MTPLQTAIIDVLCAFAILVAVGLVELFIFGLCYLAEHEEGRLIEMANALANTIAVNALFIAFYIIIVFLRRG